LIRIHLIVKGKVQGVGYRNNAKRRADQLGLRGWIKNLSNGSVEIIAQGSEKKIEEFVAWCQKGPIISTVEEVQIEKQEPDTDFWDFKVIK